MSQLYDRCNRCGRLTYLKDGFCPDCISYARATGSYSYNSSQTRCPSCNGTGKQVHMIGPDTKCPRCHGTGRI